MNRAAIIAALAMLHCGGASAPPEVVAVAKARDAAVAPPAPAVWRSCLLDGASPCLSTVPVRVRDGLLAWSSWIEAYADQHAGELSHGVTECRWVAELDQVLLCGSSDLEAMNPPLMRPSMFVEQRPRVVVKRSDPQYLELVGLVGGFDLVKDHPDPARPDLLGFYAAVDAACATDRTSCADDREQAMRTLLERAWVDKPNLVLVTFASRSTIPVDETVSHEMLHAQYFTSPAFRQVVDAYWTNLPLGARNRVRAALSPPYNGQDDELMRNELQAYMLMSGAESAHLRRLVGTHRAPLLAQLAASGLAPIQVERRPTSNEPEPEPAPGP